MPTRSCLMWLSAAVIALAVTAWLALVGQAGRHTGQPCPTPAPAGPNIVFIMTDDQGDMLGDTAPDVMPQLHTLLELQGQRFLNYFAPTPLCCPSRVTIFRGQFAHNHNYTDVLGPAAGGVAGYAWFKALRVDSSYLPTWLQGLGYNTYYTGKFLVDYNVRNFNDTPHGWTDIDALVGPYTFQYYDPVFSRNGGTPQQYTGQYTTDVVTDKALAQIRTAVAAGKPFYLQVSSIAPHFSSGGPVSPAAVANSTPPHDVSVPRYPPLPAPRHWHLFSDKQLPRPLHSFDEADVRDKPAWVRSLPRLTRANVTFLEEVYRNRLRALRAVDELLARLVAQLDALGVLDNTYLIFTSDNGYHMGTHRRASGKLSAYEEDIHVPFIIRGPGIQPGSTSLHQASHADLAPTLLALAGALAPPEMDGYPLPLTRDSRPGAPQLPASYPAASEDMLASRRQLPLTYYAGGNGDFDEYFADRPLNANWTWKALRVLDADSAPDTAARTEPHRLFPAQRGFKYGVLCSNVRELYALRHDPNEVDNLLPAEEGLHPGVTPVKSAEEASRQGHAPLMRGLGTMVSRSGLARLVKRLDVLLQALQACWGHSCRHPFQIIHNDSHTGVQDLWDALSPLYDHIYDKVPWFRFRSCQRYQDYGNEVNHYRGILGTFPRGPDGVSLAPINVTGFCQPRTGDVPQPCGLLQLWQRTRQKLGWLWGLLVGTKKAFSNPMEQTGSRQQQGASSQQQQQEQQAASGVFMADVERFAVPLSPSQLHLTDEQLYGPPGAAGYLT